MRRNLLVLVLLASLQLHLAPACRGLGDGNDQGNDDGDGNDANDAGDECGEFERCIKDKVTGEYMCHCGDVFCVPGSSVCTLVGGLPKCEGEHGTVAPATATPTWGSWPTWPTWAPPTPWVHPTPSRPPVSFPTPRPTLPPPTSRHPTPAFPTTATPTTSRPSSVPTRSPSPRPTAEPTEVRCSCPLPSTCASNGRWCTCGPTFVCLPGLRCSNQTGDLRCLPLCGNTTCGPNMVCWGGECYCGSRKCGENQFCNRHPPHVPPGPHDDDDDGDLHCEAVQGGNPIGETVTCEDGGKESSLAACEAAQRKKTLVLTISLTFGSLAICALLVCGVRRALSPPTPREPTIVTTTMEIV